MSSSPYPSPPTSNTSSPRLESEYQNNLRQLEVAFSRVRQLRRTIMQSEVTSRAQDTSSLGPPHEAILLTPSGGQSSERPGIELAAWERLRSVLPPETMERLRQYEARQAERPLRMTTSHLSPLHTGSRPSPLSSIFEHSQGSSTSSHPLSSITRNSQTPISPVSPPRQSLLPRRSLEVSHSPQWREVSDDPHTTLGRRVAALESTVNRHSSDSASRRTADNTTYSIPSLIERDLEFAVRALARQRRSEPTPRSSTDSLRPDAEARSSRSLDSPLSHSMRASSRRSRNIRGDSRQNSSSRLSMLSNFAVENLPTPGSSTLSQSLLFDEPTSYETHERMEAIDEENSERNYVVNRRTTVTGEEYVHPIHVDWNDLADIPASSPVLMQADRPMTFATRVTRRPEDVLQPSDVVRLNADGEEVEEVEFSSLELREWPRWRTAADDFQSNRHDRAYQVVILPNGREESWPCDVLNSKSTNDMPRTIGSTTPFYVDPLPIPVEKMVPSKTSSASQTKGSIRISKHACLAGR